MSALSPNLEIHGFSHAEKMLPIRIPRTLRGRDDEKENVASTNTKYSKVVINLPGLEGTTVTTRRNTFHPTEVFLTPLKPSDRPAVTSPRNKKLLVPARESLTSAKSPLVRLQKLREESQLRIRDSTLESSVSVVRELAHIPASNRGNQHLNQLESSPSKHVEVLGDAEPDAIEPLGETPEIANGPGPSDPLSVPLFTRLYVESLQQEHYDKIEELESIITSKTREIKSLRDKSNDLENSISDLQQSLIQQENRLNALKDKKGQTEEELLFITAEVVSLKGELSLLELQKKQLKEIITALKIEAEEKDVSFSLLQNRINDFEVAQVERLQLIEDLEKSLALSRTQVDTLKEEKSLLLDSLDKEEANSRSLQRDLNVSITELGEFKEETLQLRATVEEKELAQKASSNKLQDLMKETSTIHEEMAIFEKEYKQVEAQLREKSNLIESLEAENSNRKIQVDDLQSKYATAEAELALLQKASEQLSMDKIDLTDQVRALRSQHAEKDEIISGDTKKLSELVLEIDALKKALASKSRRDEIEEERNGNHDAQQRITSLQQQIALAQEKTEERIQEVAEQLYHQYSKKHEVKVGQLKRKFEAKLEENRKEVDTQKRKIEALERLLLAETKDKNHLLMLLEDKDLLRTK